MPIQVSARAIKIGDDGTPEVLGDFNEYVLPGTSQMGCEFPISDRIAQITHINADALKARGAKRMRDVLPEFVKFIRSFEKDGPTVLAGQNIAFDLRFMNYTLGREELGIVEDGE